MASLIGWPCAVLTHELLLFSVVLRDHGTGGRRLASLRCCLLLRTQLLRSRLLLYGRRRAWSRGLRFALLTLLLVVLALLLTLLFLLLRLLLLTLLFLQLALLVLLLCLLLLQLLLTLLLYLLLLQLLLTL